MSIEPRLRHLEVIMRSRYWRALWVAAVLVPLMLAGCTGTSTTGTGGDLEDVQWQLEQYLTDGALKDVPDAATVWAEFKAGELTGQAVNSYSGTYEATKDGSLTIGEISSTLMAGPPEIQAVETAYFDALQKVASYTSDGSLLTLYDKDGSELLKYGKSEVGLVGSWTVTGYNNGKQAVVSVIATSTLTMEFAEDGGLAGDSGVNTYNTKYTTTGTGEIDINPPATTKMAGPDELMQQEQMFLAALTASKSYEIRGTTLAMRDISGATQVTAQRMK